MNSFAHLLDRNLHLLQPGILVVAFIMWAIVVAILFLKGRRERYSRRRISLALLSAAAGFVAIILAEHVSGAIIRQAALNEVAARLSQPVGSVTIDGAKFDREDELVSALRQMQDTLSHHSHPTTGYHVSIEVPDGVLNFDIRRDSERRREYWVYYPNYFYTQSNNIGRMFTDALDGP